MEMIIMPVIGRTLLIHGSSGRETTHGPLDCGVDEYSLHGRVFPQRRAPPPIAPGPCRSDGREIFAHHIRRGYFLPLCAGVRAALASARCPRRARSDARHGPSAWGRRAAGTCRRRVFPANRRRAPRRGRMLEEIDQRRMSPVSIARKAHHLPVRSVDWECWPPARHPLNRSRWVWRERTPPRARPNSSLAGVPGSEGWASGGSGLGSSVPLLLRRRRSHHHDRKNKSQGFQVKPVPRLSALS